VQLKSELELMQCSSEQLVNYEDQIEEISEYRLVPCSTETGELESENWVGISR
jgi:hypothetical protein